MTEEQQQQPPTIKHFEDLGYTVVATPHECHVSYKVHTLMGISTEGEHLWPLKDSDSYEPQGNLDEAAIYLHGYVKWDGCSNWHFDEQDDVMLHGCSREDLTGMGEIMAVCWDMARELCPKWNEDVATGNIHVMRPTHEVAEAPSEDEPPVAWRLSLLASASLWEYVNLSRHIRPSREHKEFKPLLRKRMTEYVPELIECYCEALALGFTSPFDDRFVPAWAETVLTRDGYIRHDYCRRVVARKIIDGHHQRRIDEHLAVMASQQLPKPPTFKEHANILKNNPHP